MPGEQEQQHQHQQLRSEGAPSIRWAILLCTCGGLFGQYFAFDIPSVLNEQLKDRMEQRAGTTEEEYLEYFSLLYSVYSVPNMLLPLVLGIAVDRWGCKQLIVCLALCVVIGHLVFSAGISSSSWATMWIGRALFGIGSESLEVAQSTLLFHYFKGREVAFALGLNLSVARAGSVFTDIASPWVAQRWGFTGALSLGGFFCILGLLCNVGSVLLGNTAEGRQPTVCALEAARTEAEGKDSTASLRESLQLPRLYWLLATLSVLIYSGILPFNNIASAYFVETRFARESQANAQVHAGRTMSLLFMVAALATPPFGALVDRVGKRLHFLLGSAVLLTICYAGIFWFSPALTMLGLGCVYTVFAVALWPALAIAVPEWQLGTAYGVASSMQNAGLALVPLLVGRLQAQAGEGNFGQVMQLFMCFGVAGTLICVLLFRLGAESWVLNLPSSEVEHCHETGERVLLRRKAEKDKA